MKNNKLEIIIQLIETGKNYILNKKWGDVKHDRS